VRCKLQLCDTRIGRIMHKIRSLGLDKHAYVF
jgi:hypothetical protein